MERPVVLKAKWLDWSIRGHALVDDISPQVSEGEMLGLVRPNGSGISTLVRLLSSVVARHQGSVHFGSQLPGALGRRAVALRLAVVRQQAQTADRLTVRDAVELGRTASLSALRPWSAADDPAVASALAAVGMMKLVQVGDAALARLMATAKIHIRSDLNGKIADKAC